MEEKTHPLADALPLVSTALEARNSTTNAAAIEQLRVLPVDVGELLIA